MKISKIIPILLLVLTTACASKQNYFNYNNSTPPNNANIYVKNVKVNLQENKSSSETSRLYPDAKQVGEIAKEAIVTELNNEGLYSNSKNDPNSFEAEFEINYTRTFMILTGDKYAGSRLDGYKINVYKDGKLFASRENNSQYFVDHGLIGNLKKIGKNISFTGDSEDEKKEIQAIATSLAKELKMFGK